MSESNLKNELSTNNSLGLVSIPFHISDCGGDINKEPRGRGWQLVTSEDCEAFFNKIYDNRQYKPVNGLGVKTGKDSNLTVVDYDCYKDDDRLDKGVFENLFFDKTRTIRTISGGYHFYFKYDKTLKQTQGNGRSIDIRNDGGCVVVPPTSFKKKKYKLELDTEINNLNEDQSKFLEKYFSTGKIQVESFPEPTQFGDVIILCLKCLDSESKFLTEGQEWEKVVKAVKKHLGKDGLNIILEWSKTSSLFKSSDWVVKHYEKAKLFGPLNIDWLKRVAKHTNPNQYYCTVDNNSFSVDRMIDLSDASNDPYEAAVKYFNKYHYKVKGASLTYCAIEPDKVYVWTKTNIKDMYSNAIFNYVCEDKKKQKNVVDAWLTHRHHNIAESVCFRPNFKKIDTIVDGQVNLFRGGLHKYNPNHIVNMELVSPWLDHIKNVWCNDDQILYDYTIGRIAIMFQKPWVRIPISIAVRGDQGVGKSCFVEYLGSNVLGDKHYAYFDNIDDYLGSFNSNQEQNILNFLDEINSGGSAWKQSDRLKSMSARKKKTINHKYGTQYDVEDYSNTIYATNHWSILKIEQGDRRYFMLQCNTSKLGDHRYFTWLHTYNTIESGYEMFHYLMNWNLSNWNRECIPTTDWKIQSMLQNITPAMYVILTWLKNNTPDEEEWMPESFYSIMDTDSMWELFVDKFGHLQHKMNFTKIRFLDNLRDIIGVKATKQKKIKGRNVRVYDISVEEVYDKVCNVLRIESLDQILDTYEDWSEKAGDSYVKHNCLL